MKIKYILSLICLTFCFFLSSVDAFEFTDEEFNWPTSSLSFRYEDSSCETSDFKEEIIQVSAPFELKHSDIPFFMQSYYSEDSEGMTYFVTAVFMEEGMNIWDGIDRSIESLKDNGNTLMYMTPKDEESEFTQFSLGYLSSNAECFRVSMIKGDKFLFILETDVKDINYLSLESLAENTPAFEKIMRDSLKTFMFVNSLEMKS